MDQKSLLQIFTIIQVVSQIVAQFLSATNVENIKGEIVASEAAKTIQRKVGTGFLDPSVLDGMEPIIAAVVSSHPDVRLVKPVEPATAPAPTSISDLKTLQMPTA